MFRKYQIRNDTWERIRNWRGYAHCNQYVYRGIAGGSLRITTNYNLCDWRATTSIVVEPFRTSNRDIDWEVVSHFSTDHHHWPPFQPSPIEEVCSDSTITNRRDMKMIIRHEMISFIILASTSTRFYSYSSSSYTPAAESANEITIWIFVRDRYYFHSSSCELHIHSLLLSLIPLYLQSSFYATVTSVQIQL